MKKYIFGRENLIFLQYFIVASCSAQLYVPLLFATALFYSVIYGYDRSRFQQPLWWLLFVAYVIVYAFNANSVNLQSAVFSGFSYLALLLFLIFPRSDHLKKIGMLGAAIGFSLLFIPKIVLSVILNESILGLYGRLHSILDDESLLTSHISVFLNFSSIVGIMWMSEVFGLFKRLFFLTFTLLNFSCSILLGGKFAIVVPIFALLFYRDKTRYVLTYGGLIGLVIGYLYSSELSELYNFYGYRWSQLFSEESGRLALWSGAVDVLAVNMLFYPYILNDFGYSSFHNIFLDSWRFGGIAFTFVFFIVFFVEFVFLVLASSNMRPEKKFLRYLFCVLFLIAQLEVMFEAMYKILPFFVVCSTLYVTKFKLLRGRTG